MLMLTPNNPFRGRNLKLPSSAIKKREWKEKASDLKEDGKS